MTNIYRANFEQLQGISSEKAHKRSLSWWRTNLSDNRNAPAQQLAEYFVQYHTELLQKPQMTGIIEYSATQANQRALELMKNSGRKKVIMSNLAHIPSTRDRCIALGLEAVVLDARPELWYQVPESAISEAVEHHGVGTIAGIISTHGTTQLGHREDIASYDFVQMLRKAGVWLHIDAAFGASYMGYASRAGSLIPDADTITLDPYKMIGMQGAALLLGKKERLAHPEVTYYDHSPFTHVTTLQAYPVALWANTVKDFGAQGLTQISDECIRNARLSAYHLESHGIPLIMKPRTIIVPVQLPSEEQREELRDALRNEGYLVGRIDIKGSDYETRGIRIVCAPRDSHDDWFHLRTVEDLVLRFLKKK